MMLLGGHYRVQADTFCAKKQRDKHASSQVSLLGLTLYVVNGSVMSYLITENGGEVLILVYSSGPITVRTFSK